jgi:archaellin
MKYFHKISLFLVLALALTGCTEQYVFQNTDFESALVVEGTITNELKNQTIRVSQVYQLEETGPRFEKGANVFVTDDKGNEYQFEEKDTVYASITAFRAEPGRKYQLKIKTREGKNYTSDEQVLTTETKIDNVTATVENVNGQRGVQINVNSFDPANTSKYYRYEYTETYKIIAPKWYSLEASVVTIPANPGNPIEGTPPSPAREVIAVEPRTKEVKTCFSTKKNDAIILNNTSGLSEDRVHFPVRFISDQNYIISHRYSILVKQYVQNLAAYTFYKTLRDLSTSGSVLSPKQPGFFYGNMKSVENPEEKVIGFFEVSSVSTERIYFNYADLFPNERLPPYYESDCEQEEYKNCDGDLPCRGPVLRSLLRTNSKVLYTWNYADMFYLVKTPCGDCTSFSSNIVPPFWVD